MQKNMVICSSNLTWGTQFVEAELVLVEPAFGKKRAVENIKSIEILIACLCLSLLINTADSASNLNGTCSK